MKQKATMRTTGILIVAFVAAGWLGLPARTNSEPIVNENAMETLRRTSRAFTEVAKKAIPAVVSIQVERKVVDAGSPEGYGPAEDDFLDYFFGPQPRRRTPRQESYREVGQGSGFIVSSDGYILTNNHVVGDADTIVVKMYDGRRLNARLIGADPETDVAVIKVDEKDLPAIELGNSDRLEIGEWVIAVGNPFGLSETVTVGVVSAKGRGGVGLANYEDFIQTDAAINPGNSGGPMLNLDGKAVGINTAIYSRNGGYMGIGFAIPMAMARHVMDQLIANGHVDRGFLGITMDPQDITPELAEFFGLKDHRGVIITGVADGSPADRAGLQRDDVVVEIDGKRVDNFRTFRNEIAQTTPGTEVKLTVVRGGREKRLEVRVGSMSENVVYASRQVQRLGVEVKDIDRELAEQYGYEANKGVLIAEVDPGSTAFRAGLRPGMVILNVDREPVNSVRQFDAAMAKVRGSKVFLLVQTQQFTQYFVLPLE